MSLTIKSLAVIAGLSMATAGVINIPYFSSPTNADPLQQTNRDRRQMPMHQDGGRGHHGQMMQMMQANNEFEFLSLMIPHHEEAINTAQRVLEYSERPEMQEFAQDIIDVQTAEIEQMEAWLSEWYPNQETNFTYAPMMRDLSQLEGDALDQAFLEDMIMHHMGAVMMSQRLVNRSLVEHQAVQPFAQNITSTQRQEIRQMQGWLQDWYGVTGMPMGDGMMPGGMHHRGR